MNSDDKKNIEACTALIAGLERENKIQSRLIEAQAAMIKSLEEHNAELQAFKSGEKYVRMEEQRLKEVRALERMVDEFKKELAHSRSETVTVRNQWFEIFEQLQKECERKVAEAKKETLRMEQRALKAERQRDDVNYGGSIRAFLFLLNNDCGTSIDKSSKFLSDLTGGKLNISKGMINKLSRSFAEKTESEQKKIFADMLLSPVMHTDCTNAKVNGKSTYVFVCAVPNGNVLYFAREKKGHEGVKGTVTENYQGILVHDHESTFYNYGTGHQECLAHILRYLKDSIENEPDRTWNKQMHSLVQEMIHYRNSIPEDCQPDKTAVSRFEERYREVLLKAKEEYEYIPPGRYYRDGYNLYRRMDTYMENHLLFLHDLRVHATNNEAERLLRKYKRKQTQAVSFRSQSSIDDLCQCMSMLVMMRQNKEANLFDMVSKIFE